MTKDNLPPWWDREKWKKRIEEDPSQKAFLLSKILDLAVFKSADEWEYAKMKLQEALGTKKIDRLYSIGPLIKKITKEG